MLDEEDPKNDGVNSEVNTPVTNHQGEEEEGGSSLLALIGEPPELGVLLERGLRV